MELTIVVPIYDESGSLPILIRDLESELNPGIQFLLVDNGSTDRSVVDMLRAGGTNWESFRIEENTGFGGAIKQGILRCETEFIGWFPGNLKINTQELFLAIKSLEFVDSKAIKFRRNRPGRVDNLKTFLFGILQTLSTGQNLMDSGGTPTITNRRVARVLASMDSPNDYTFESFAFLFFRVQKLKLSRPIIDYGVRVHGTSHWQQGLRSELSLLMATLRGANAWKKNIKKVVSNDAHNPAS